MLRRFSVVVGQDFERLSQKIEVFACLFKIWVLPLAQSFELFQQVYLNQTAQDVDCVDQKRDWVFPVRIFQKLNNLVDRVESWNFF